MAGGETEIGRETIPNRDRQAEETAQGQTTGGDRKTGCEGVVDRQRGSQRRKRLRNGGQGEALASSWMNADGQVDTARHIPKQRLGTDTLAQRDRASG